MTTYYEADSDGDNAGGGDRAAADDVCEATAYDIPMILLLQLVMTVMTAMMMTMTMTMTTTTMTTMAKQLKRP